MLDTNQIKTALITVSINCFNPAAKSWEHYTFGCLIRIYAPDISWQLTEARGAGHGTAKKILMTLSGKEFVQEEEMEIHSLRKGLETYFTLLLEKALGGTPDHQPSMRWSSIKSLLHA